MNVEDYSDVVTNIARRQAAGSEVMTAEDLEQELYLFLLERKDLSASTDRAWIMELLGREAKKIVRQERIDYMYFSGAFVYTPSMVRGLLEEAVWSEARDCPDIEGRVDVATAMQRLSMNERRMLYVHFGRGEKYGGDADKKTVSRAVDKITVALNEGVRVTVEDVYTA